MINRPIKPTPRQEAETFYLWYIEEMELYADEELGPLFQCLEKARPAFTQKIMEILRKIRLGNFEIDETASFKAHWYITLDHPFEAQWTFEPALKMIKAGRRDIKQMAEELWRVIIRSMPKNEHTFWEELDQIGGEASFSGVMKSGACHKMESALRTLISWL